MNELVTMFEDYAREKGFGPRILYRPGVGFATYHLIPGECYVEELYIVKEKRRSGEGSSITDEIAKIAKEAGIGLLTGSVSLKANGKGASIRALLDYGMTPTQTSGDMIYFSKEI